MSGHGMASLAALVILIPLEQLHPVHQGRKFLRPGWSTDLCHFVLNHLLVRTGLFIVFVTALLLLQRYIPTGLLIWTHRQPWIAQFLAALLIADILHYTAHLLCHRVPLLWRFHVIHHSSEQLDSLAAARVHPFDQIFMKAFTVIPLALLGLDASVFGSYLFLTAAQAIFVHANLRISFGPLRYLIATPEFHHWHHSSEPEAIDKNLAGQFPWLDAILGSLYLPKRWPKRYGATQPTPEGYLNQLVQPLLSERPIAKTALVAKTCGEDDARS